MKSPSTRLGFTLIELAAAFAVFSLILLAVGAMVQQSTVSWRRGSTPSPPPTRSAPSRTRPSATCPPPSARPTSRSSSSRTGSS
ncbi:MAG: prepilin-type N-terminal cleavage/methylation domain-containing protein [Kiritimatiellia bacterium]